MNVMIALITAPKSMTVASFLSISWYERPSTLAPPNALMIGSMIAPVKVLTSAVNAVPMTTATARSTMLPRSRKSLKP